jgi:hypothetical protein
LQKRVLRDSRDYFVNVVVPSRSNDRVDEIVFVAENRVLAYTLNARGIRLILYEFELINGQWKINA